MKSRRTLSGRKSRLALIMSLVLILMMVCGTVMTYALTEETDQESNHKYTIRIFAGNVEGAKIDGGDVVVYEKTETETFSFYQSSVTGYDKTKYYVSGIREAGIDNYDPENPQLTGNVKVDGDKDYVVAYGVLGSSAQYTINYEDTAGNALAPSETYYGNVGDRPVIAYLYIDGYFPNAYNLTRTLQADNSQNVFTFIYQPIEGTEAPVPQTPAQAGTTTTTTTGGTATTAAGGTAAGTAGGTAAGAAGTAAGAAGTAAGAAGTAAGAAGAAGTEGAAAGGETANLPETPQAVPEIIDQDVPMAVPENNSSSSSSSSAASSSSSSSTPTTETISENDTPRAGMTGGKIAGIVIAIAAAAAAAIFGGRYALNKRRENSIESSTESETYKFDDDGNLKKKD